MAAFAAPQYTYKIAQYLCQKDNITAFDTNYEEYCNSAYSPDATGNIMTGIYSLLDVHGDAGKVSAI